MGFVSGLRKWANFQMYAIIQSQIPIYNTLLYNYISPLTQYSNISQVNETICVWDTCSSENRSGYYNGQENYWISCITGWVTWAHWGWALSCRNSTTHSCKNSSKMNWTVFCMYTVLFNILLMITKGDKEF